MNFLFVSSHADQSTQISAHLRTSEFLIFRELMTTMFLSRKYPSTQREDEAMKRYFVAERNI
ncbi:unnamed protein product [Bathycoccus prasinos]